MSTIRKPLTKMVEFEQRDVLLRDILVDPEHFQTRAGTDMRVVKVYSDARAAGSVFPPVVLFQTPEDELILADGYHRWEAWKRLGLKNIRAVIRKGTAQDAILFGIEANFAAENIRQVTAEDRKHAVQLMIRNEAFREWSDTSIAKQCGVSSILVCKTRVEMKSNEGIEIPARVFAIKDGSPTGQTFKYRIGRNSAPTMYKNRSGNNGKSPSFMATVDGKKVYLGTEPIAAEERLRSVFAERDELKVSLKSPNSFRQWLYRRGVPVEGMHEFRENDMLGAWHVNDCILFVAADNTASAFCEMIGRALLVRTQGYEESRVVIIRAPGSHTPISRVIALASQLTPPIEFMTPGELVAEFGPKNADGSPVTPAPDDDDPTE